MFGPFSPISRSASISSFEEDPTTPRSPRTEKLVGVCKNCSHSFRVKSTSSAEFCSKDCETCFTIFYKNASPRPVNNQQDRTTQEVRLSILQFQQQMDAQDKFVVTPPVTPIQDQSAHMVQNTTEFDDCAYELFKSEKKRLKQENNTTPFSDHTDRETNDSVLGKIAHKLFFTTPKPLRPQLHAFF